LATLVKPGAGDLLRDQAARLEKQAAQLRKLAQQVHHQQVLADLGQLMKQPEDKLDLVRGALLLARLDNEDVDVDAYRGDVDRLARAIAAELPKKADAKARLDGLIKALFQERGFHGSRLEYYSRHNSYLNEVLDDREGLPITLSVLFMELARRLDLKVVGVPLPGHFMVRFEPEKGEGQLIDVYEGGTFMTRAQAADKVKKMTGRPLKDQELESAAKKAILLRMTNNLLNVAQNERDQPASLRYLDAILTIEPQAHDERWVRAVFRFQSGQREGAFADCDFLLDANPPDADLDRVRELRKLLLKGTR
jgi:regulator of sirC expression with transglutaminase-like and TPR domain